MEQTNGSGTRNLWGALGLMSTFLIISLSVAFGYTSIVADRVEFKEDKTVVAKNYDLLLYEVRESRKEITFLRDEVVAMRTILSGSKVK